MRSLPGAGLLGVLAHLAFAPPAGAYMLLTDSDGHRIAGVRIEKEYGDVVELAYLPKPFDRLVLPSQEGGKLAFRWTYRQIPSSGPGLALGRFRIGVDAHGSATVRFEFSGHDLTEGAVYAAAAALLGPDRKAMHTFYARTGTEAGGFAGDGKNIALTLERRPQWWGSVRVIVFFFMQYHNGRELGAAAVGEAMRRAVGRLTGGEGDEQEE